jgi:hypothetical protein
VLTWYLVADSELSACVILRVLTRINRLPSGHMFDSLISSAACKNSHLLNQPVQDGLIHARFRWFIAEELFINQPKEFVHLLLRLAHETDEVKTSCGASHMSGSLVSSTWLN